MARRDLLHGRHGVARRGRILLVRGTRRRRDQELGLPHRAFRGRKCADDPSCGGGVRHHGRSRRDSRAGGQGDDHPCGEIPRAGRGGARQGVAGPCETHHGTL